MDRYQLIDEATGRKLNVILWDGESSYDPPEGQRIEPDDGAPIWSEPIPDAAPAVPDAVEDWQFAGQAAEERIITEAEALDWSGAGIVPPTLVKAVDDLRLDAGQRFRVMIFLRGSKSYPRHHHLVPLLGRLFGKTDDAALDAFWIAAKAR